MLSLVGYRTNIHISTTKSKKAFAFLQRLLFIGETGLAATQAEPTPRRRSRWAPLQAYKVNRPPADVGLGFLLFVCNLVRAWLVHKNKKNRQTRYKIQRKTKTGYSRIFFQSIFFKNCEDRPSKGQSGRGIVHVVNND